MISQKNKEDQKDYRNVVLTLTLVGFKILIRISSMNEGGQFQPDNDNKLGELVASRHLRLDTSILFQDENSIE